MDLQMDDQVVVVTGTAHGIGRGIAERLLGEGARVIGVDREPTGKPDFGSGYSAITLDVTAAGAAARIVAMALERHGRLDGLVNNVGVTRLYPGFLDIPEQAWQDSFDTNFHAARRLTAAALPALLGQGGGSIVHISTDAARYPGPQELHYSSAKTALLNLSKGLAMEFGSRGVRSNVVTPGPTRTWLHDVPGGWGDQAAAMLGMDREAAIAHVFTEMRPAMTGRMGAPEDVAPVVAYLLSPLARQVTGAEWTVDGGTLRQI